MSLNKGKALILRHVYWKRLFFVTTPQHNTVYVSTIYFILKQGYMFRLKVSHLQVLTTFFVTRCFAHFGIPQCLQLWDTS